MKSIDILYSEYIADDHKTKTIGGIQTYITDLSNVISDMGYKVRIVQFAKEYFETEIADCISVIGFPIECRKSEQQFQSLYNCAVDSRTGKCVLTIFATDSIIPKHVKGPCIAIQHGICWDIPRKTKKHTLIRQIAARAYSAYGMVQKLSYVNGLICVDYNFLNWYRTQVNYVAAYTQVIPNYTRVASRQEKPMDDIHIIFARRLFEYRGTRVFTAAVKRILDEYKQVTVTIAGSGPDEEWMREQLSGYGTVEFIYYESQDSLRIHQDKHIAVVPTIGSEGTSLSLLEAMAAGCAVVCTNIGGMTNIVIDGYNGLMVSPDEESIYRAIKKLVDDEQFRYQLADKAYETACQGFSYEKWKTKWETTIQGMLV